MGKTALPRKRTASAAESRVRLSLLGGFDLSCDGQPLLPAYEKARALLAYLATRPGATAPRGDLAGLLWPGKTRPAALANLRLLVHDLRRLLPEVLQVSSDALGLVLARLDVDVIAFTRPEPVCLSGNTDRCLGCLAELEDLCRHYRGEFLAGYALPDCDQFESWLQEQRQALQERAVSLFDRLAECHWQLSGAETALPFARRLLELAPGDEGGLRRLMSILSQVGRKAEALAIYEQVRRTQERDLRLPLPARTRALAESLRRGEAPVPTEIPPTTTAAGFSRRQITVIACELKTEAALDPERALDLLEEPQSRCLDIIRRHRGTPVQGFGGSLLAYFGYPQAVEQAAVQAVLAAWEIAAGRSPGVDARLGVMTGVMVSGGDPPLPDAVGSFTRQAIALALAAEAGTVVVGDTTAGLVSGWFHCQPSAAGTWQVTAATGAACRLEALPAVAPLVGRQAEMAALQEEWALAAAGRQRAVWLSGDAGIGKSRLIAALHEALGRRGRWLREVRCAAEYRDVPYYPLRALVQGVLRIGAGDSPEMRSAKLAGYLERQCPGAEPDAVPVLASLFGLPLPVGYRTSALAPQRQRELGHQLLLRQLDRMTGGQPALLVAEDLQWADPSTLELLGRLLAGPGERALLILLTARTGFEPPWDVGPNRSLRLEALDRESLEALVAHAAPALGSRQTARIAARADGVPLFAEELARQFAHGTVTAVPASLQDLLAVRLDAQGEAKALAEAASVIGRSFDERLLAAVAGIGDEAVRAGLARLQEAGLVAGDGRGGWQFRHALIRDAAYEAQTRDLRALRHQRAVVALAEAPAPVPSELLAQHHAAGGQPRQAILCWTAAGLAASRHSAASEACHHFRAGLVLLPEVAAAERDRLELEIQIGLGAAIGAAEGYGAPEAASAYARARQLCERGQGQRPELFPALWGLWASASSTGGYTHALRLARRLHRLAGAGADPVHLQQARFALGNTLYWRGEFAAAYRHLAAAESLYRLAHHQRHLAEFGEDGGVTVAAYLSWVLHAQGDVEAALEAGERAVVLARRLGHPFSLAYALTFAALLRCRRREPQPALALAEEARSLAGRHGYGLWETGGVLAQGWALALQGRSEGEAAIRGCIEVTRAAMGGVGLLVLEALADACAALGDADCARAVCRDALAQGQQTEDHHADVLFRSLLAPSAGAEFTP